jgi:hypothetical protein
VFGSVAAPIDLDKREGIGKKLSNARRTAARAE